MSGGSVDQQTGRIMLVRERTLGNSSLPILYSNFVKRLRIDESVVSPDYAAWFWNFLYQRRRMFVYEKRTTGIRNFKLNDFLDNESVAYPSPREQKVIVSTLECVLAAKEAAEKTIAAARQLKASLMRHLFTYGPVPAGAADRVTLKETEFGSVPSHWEVGRIGNHAKVGNGSTPRRTNASYWEGGTIPWLTSGKVYDRIIREANEYVTEIACEECHLPLVKKGSIVVAITGQGKTLGNAALLDLDTCVSQHLAYIQPKDDRIVPEFLLAFLHQRYEHFRDVSSGGGSTKGALTCGFLKGYPCPLPPKDEQTEIAAIIKAAERKWAASRSRAQALDALFRSLLHHLMTGKIRVGNFAPTTPEGCTS